LVFVTSISFSLKLFVITISTTNGTWNRISTPQLALHRIYLCPLNQHPKRDLKFVFVTSISPSFWRLKFSF
jgi:hypothetical protein